LRSQIIAVNWHRGENGVNRKTLILTAMSLIIIVSLAMGTYVLILLKAAPRPSWMKVGAYMTYEQFFTWAGQNETELMTWSLTRLQDDLVDLRLVSHGVDVNEGNVAIVAGEENWTINADSREITNSMDSYYIGYKCPFWIEKDAKIGSGVDVLYGKTTISKSETIDALGQRRDCWVVEYDWTTSGMKRWYDKSTGIVLKIDVIQFKQNIRIETTETAVQTNVNLMP